MAEFVSIAFIIVVLFSVGFAVGYTVGSNSGDDHFNRFKF